MRIARYKIAAVIGVMAFLSACSSTPENKAVVETPANAQYCDNYLMYEMCADDLNKDGVSDILYFTDTNEVFMLNPYTSKSLIASLELHECVQMMDDDLINASSALHTISDQTGTLRKGKLKAGLMLNYARYMSKINKCRQSTGEYAIPDDSETFGDNDYDEL